MCQTIFPSKNRSSVCWWALSRSQGLLSCTKEAISVQVVGSISGSSSKQGSHCRGGLCCRAQPTAPIPGVKSCGADSVSAVGSVHAGCLLALHSPTSDAVLRRQRRSVGKAGAAGCSVGPLAGLAGMPGWARCAHRVRQLCVGAAEPLSCFSEGSVLSWQMQCSVLLRKW